MGTGNRTMFDLLAQSLDRSDVSALTRSPEHDEAFLVILAGCNQGNILTLLF